jgi:membrane-bound metal-dependent hydrolase YbcI (DUF457 family)
MNYAGHLTGGLVSAGIVGCTSFVMSGLNISIGALCAVTTLIMALYPDFDVASTPSKYSYIIGIPTIIGCMYFGKIFTAMLVLAFIGIPKMFTHRGFVHTLRFGFMATICWILILNPYIGVNVMFTLIAGMIGYLTHLLLDSHMRL